MRLSRWIHHFKVAIISSVVVAVAALLCGVLWLNEKGFGGEWGNRIAAELSVRGVYADFHNARFSPLRGIIIHDAVIYLDEAKTRVFARIPRLRIDIDRAKASRGELLLRKLELHDAELSIPLAGGPGGTGDGDPTTVEISRLSGDVTIDRQGGLLLQNARGHLAGMAFTLHAEFDHFELGLLSERARESAGRDRGEFLELLFAELGRWSFPTSTAPQLDLRLAGNLEKPSSIHTAFTLEADELGRNGYPMKEFVLSGSLLGQHLAIKRLHFSDGAGDFTTRADYDLGDREGRYTISSSIHIGRMLRTCFDNHVLDELVSPQAPRIDGKGTVHHDPGGSFRIGATGTLDLPRFRFLGNSFERLQTDFSWQKEGIFLRNLRVTHRDGSLSGQVLIQEENITYRAKSTLPVSVFSPFITEGSGLHKIIAHCEFSPDSLVEIEADLGTIVRGNLKQWASAGRAKLTKVSYRGVPLREITANYSITPLEHIYSNIEARFDYSRYPPRRRHGTAATGLVRAERISHDRDSKLTRIKNLRGTAWPAPVLRLFAPKAADHVEDKYRFRQPPSFVANGLVGHKKAAALTDVDTSLQTHDITDYTFLHKDLALRQLSARIRYRHRLVDVTDLAFRVFEGPVGGHIRVKIKPGAPAAYSGDIRWTRLRLAAIGNTYGFAKADQGYVTGRFTDFSGVSGNIRALRGTGVVGLERGHLFFVPILGPLSSILGGVLGDKRASHEEARDASCTFAIRDGILHTRDFLTSTPSTVFTAEGTIDLHLNTINMTARMNARGLLGLLTLPLRPFNGLFQFSGKGPLRKPVWRSAPFEPPSSRKNDPIFRKPGRAVVVPER